MHLDCLNLVAAIQLADLPQQLVNGIMTGAIYALIALGYTMVYGVLRLINFAHGEVFMLGTFGALFMSWWMGHSPGAHHAAAQNPTVLILMLVFAMVLCGLIGVTIERLAYRPLRNQPRITSLITAIGVSLLLQAGGALVLPINPPQSINESVNPYAAGRLEIPIQPRSADLIAKEGAAKSEIAGAKETLKRAMEAEGAKSIFELKSAAGLEAKGALRAAEQKYGDAKNAADKSGITVTVSWGKIIMFFTTVFLMFALRWLVMKTPIGRQMRAVSHDFDSASLMGINVNRIVTFTFFIGSALAGAGGMMAATFQGIPLTSLIGMEYGTKAFVAAVLGGIGNIPGAVLGGLLMGLAESLVTAAGASQFKDIIAFLILIIVLLVRPGGILGSAKVEKV